MIVGLFDVFENLTGKGGYQALQKISNLDSYSIVLVNVVYFFLMGAILDKVISKLKRIKK